MDNKTLETKCIIHSLKCHDLRDGVPTPITSHEGLSYFSTEADAKAYSDHLIALEDLVRDWGGIPKPCGQITQSRGLWVVHLDAIIHPYELDRIDAKLHNARHGDIPSYKEGKMPLWWEDSVD